MLFRSAAISLVGLVWAAGFAAFAVVSSPWVAGPVLCVLFVVSPASGRQMYNITVGAAPHEMLGRVSTAENMISSSLATVAPMLAGVMLEYLHATSTWLVLAAICALVTGVAVLPMVLARKAAQPPEPAQPGGPVPEPAQAAGQAERT